MKQKRDHQITIDSDWSTTAAMALALLFTAGFAILEMRHLLLGQVLRVSPSTVFTALGCMVLAIRFKGILLKIAFALLFVQAASRIILSHTNASYAFKHLAAMWGMALKIVGLLMVVVAIVKWFRSQIRWIPTPNPGSPTS